MTEEQEIMMLARRYKLIVNSDPSRIKYALRCEVLILMY